MALARYLVVRLDEVIAGGIRGVLYDGLFGETEHIPPSQLKTYARSFCPSFKNTFAGSELSFKLEISSSLASDSNVTVQCGLHGSNLSVLLLDRYVTPKYRSLELTLMAPQQ